MVRAFDMQALVGQLGGYIGLFLGYTLMMIPQFFQGIGTRICHRIGNRTEPVVIDQMQNEEDGDLIYLKLNVDNLSKTIVELQIQLKSIQEKMERRKN